jgi:hypothetical protein
MDVERVARLGKGSGEGNLDLAAIKKTPFESLMSNHVSHLPFVKGE